MIPPPGFRRLFFDLRNDFGNLAAKDILLAYETQALETMSALRPFGDLAAMSWREGDPDLCRGDDSHGYYTCLEQLYALSRVSDLLILPFQPVWDPGDERVTPWGPHVEWKPTIRLEERGEWLRSLGMREVEPRPFHPFYHEIVEVEQSLDPDEPISLLETLWPAFMLGDMLFCRAGVRIRAGAPIARKEVAEHSRLYWAYTRDNRPPNDRSHG